VAFAVGAVVAALAMGGALYAAYPASFRGYSSSTSTGANTYTAPPLLDATTNTASVSNDTAISQNTTETTSGLGTNSSSNATESASAASPQSFPSGGY